MRREDFGVLVVLFLALNQANAFTWPKLEDLIFKKGDKDDCLLKWPKLDFLKPCALLDPFKKVEEKVEKDLEVIKDTLEDKKDKIVDLIDEKKPVDKLHILLEKLLDKKEKKVVKPVVEEEEEEHSYEYVKKLKPLQKKIKLPEEPKIVVKCPDTYVYGHAKEHYPCSEEEVEYSYKPKPSYKQIYHPKSIYEDVLIDHDGDNIKYFS